MTRITERTTDPKVFISYVPHGINPEKFYKITEEHEEWEDFQKFKKETFGDKEYKYVVLYNSRNIRRKMTSDVLLAFDTFVQRLPEEKRDKVVLLMHTQPVDQNGTDLPAVIRDVCSDDINVIFTKGRLDELGMNALYNLADVLINISSNEGFGLSVAEALMCEVPAIVNVTGGLQDQCGFKDEEGNLLDPEEHFNHEWGSNYDGRYKDHGEWVIPVFPKTRSLVGSPITPYIFDDRVDWMDVADAIEEWYLRGPVIREKAGRAGKEFCMNEGGLNSENMCKIFMDDMDRAMEEFEPRQRFVLESI